jgi:DNA-binding CsgD family transcriptional regulator
MARIVCEQRDDIPARGLPMSLLADIKEQIGCDIISFEGFDSQREVTWFLQAIRGPEHITVDHVLADSFEPVHWEHYWNSEPCSYPDRTGDFRTIVAIGDFYSTRQWHSTGMYSDLYRPKGLEHELMLTLPSGGARGSGPGPSLRLFLFRGPGRDFSEADRALLALIRPHLHQAHLDAQRHREPRLTPRHWELLHLLAAGQTNAQIARRLGISEGTVRKHLENIYGRLQVSSRTAAVTRAFGSAGERADFRAANARRPARLSRGGG